uniref:Uncharacterized protein n=1 Tax=Leersia perrieri TaxID=77586 RepID=A0A0D9VNZ2_9ORYZ
MRTVGVEEEERVLLLRLRRFLLLLGGWRWSGRDFAAGGAVQAPIGDHSPPEKEVGSGAGAGLGIGFAAAVAVEEDLVAQNARKAWEMAVMPPPKSRPMRLHHQNQR